MNCYCARARRHEAGMTLIEILVVVALIALLTGTLVFGSGLMGGAQRRAAATLVIAGVRKGLAHANSSGNPVRMVFDFGASRIWLEESSSRVALRSDPDEEDEQPESHAERVAEQAEAEAEQIVTGKAGEATRFSPVDILGGNEEQPGRSFDEGVRLVLVQTEHDEEPITEGRAYLYFWPGGLTERAVVQIARGSDDDGLTVMVSALTGRAKIEKGRVPLPEPRFGDEEFSEREEF